MGEPGRDGSATQREPGSSAVALGELREEPSTTGHHASAGGKFPAFVEVSQFEDSRTGQLARGTPFRILGSFVQAHWEPAQTNPIGVDAWTEVWIQVRDLGSKAFPVWIPKRLERGSFRRGDDLEIRAHYFRRIAFETRDGVRFSPLFIAAELDRYEEVTHPATTIAGFVFAGFIASIAALFWLIARSDGRRRKQHEEKMAAKRRNRTLAELEGARA